LNRIQKAFAQSASEDRLVLGTYLVAGYPTYESSLDAALKVVEAGSDMIELGIPFSDPVADGKVLASAHKTALERGMNPPKALCLAEEIRASVQTPILFMTYYNPVLQYGQERFVSECQAAGIDGLLVPDLPIEESEELRILVKSSGMNLIYFLSPNSPTIRIRATATVANGFVYLFSSLGVTGERDRLGPSLREAVQRIREMVTTPICVGFGISGPDQVLFLKRLGIDGIVVGSGIVRRQDEGLDSVKSFVTSLRQACHRART